MNPVVTGRGLAVYEVQAAIGAGGMGAVYLALDTSLNRPVAIMVLSDALADPAGPNPSIYAFTKVASQRSIYPVLVP